MSLQVDDPLELFGRWLEEASASEPNDPAAMTLSTVGADGMPSSRMVMMNNFDASGFVFYTNLGSKKSLELLAHPRAALLFHWKSLRRQVHVQGTVTQVSSAEADDYFANRPRRARIGVWASKQSQPMEGRWVLEKRVAEFGLKLGFGEIPRPPFWSGFRVAPEIMEFWKDNALRLYDRVRLVRQADGSWVRTVLYP